MHRVSEISDPFVYVVFSPLIESDVKMIYLSAGVHGDESGATEGLLRWAESSQLQLNSLPLLIFPCLNPWGLKNNSRFDSQGIDLNRVWDQSNHPLIGPIIDQTNKLSLKLVLNLHEDYDGQGIYLYEPSTGGRPGEWAERILLSAELLLPRDQRKSIEGRKCRNGIIRPRPHKPPADGMPEALHLYLTHQCPTFTIETPSEMDLDIRAQAHEKMISEAIRMASA